MNWMFKVISRLYVEHFKVTSGFGVEDHPRPFSRSYLKIVQNVIQGHLQVICEMYLQDYFKAILEFDVKDQQMPFQGHIQKLLRISFKAISMSHELDM